MASTEKKTKEDHSKKFKQDTNLLFCVPTQMSAVFRFAVFIYSYSTTPFNRKWHLFRIKYLLR